MNKQEKETFLRSGGMLLRHNVVKGQHVIEYKTSQKDWSTRLQVNNKNIADDTIDLLAKNHPNKYQKQINNKD